MTHAAFLVLGLVLGATVAALVGMALGDLACATIERLFP